MTAIKADKSDQPNIGHFILHFEDVSDLLDTFLRLSYNTDGPWTNNHLEGWHDRQKIFVGKQHLNV